MHTEIISQAISHWVHCIQNTSKNHPDLHNWKKNLPWHHSGKHHCQICKEKNTLTNWSNALTNSKKLHTRRNGGFTLNWTWYKEMHIYICIFANISEIHATFISSNGYIPYYKTHFHLGSITTPLSKPYIKSSRCNQAAITNIKWEGKNIVYYMNMCVKYSI